MFGRHLPERGTLITSIVCMVAVYAAALAARQSGDPFLRISFIDVGQGDAIWIKGPDGLDGTPGGNIIIDGGPTRRFGW